MAGQVITRINANSGTHLISTSFYGTCFTAAGTAAKAVIVNNPNITDAITLVIGMMLTVKFINSNSIANPTITVYNNSGIAAEPIQGSTTLIAAKSIYQVNTNLNAAGTAASTTAATSWKAGAIVVFVYDGQGWVEVSSTYNQDNDTTALTSMTGTLTIAQGGTGETTATEAWTALGGGDIGKKSTLSASDIPNISTSKLTSGILEVARGGTGLTAAPSMIVNLESTAAVSIFDATSSPGVTGTLPISQGGTGATAASQARQNLNVPTVSSQTNQNVFFSPLSASNQCQGIYFNVTNNANTTCLNKRLGLIIKNEGISLYNSTDNATIWNINLPVSIAQGGTGKTTATEAWTALGGGAIGKKASLTASDIPSLSASKITSGTLAITRGGNGPATGVKIAENTAKTLTVYQQGRVITVVAHGVSATPGASTTLLTIPQLDGYPAVKPEYNVSALVTDTSAATRIARLWVDASTGGIKLAIAGYTSSSTWYGTLTYIAPA